jgi:lipoprotein-anchoring transpeptidase ErfK/SrfK
MRRDEVDLERAGRCDDGMAKMADPVLARRIGFFYALLAGLGLIALLLLVIPFSPFSPAGEAPANAADIGSAPRAQAGPPVKAGPVVEAAPAAALVVPTAAPASEPFEVQRLLPVTRWLKPREYVWDEAVAPSGAVRIVVDLRARTLSVYRSGVEIGRSFITYGTEDHPTPLGRFPIMEKDADHYSSIYNRAPMPWMLRLTGDGVAIHGGEVEDDIATRGCIGLPKEFAKLLFKQAKVGTEVLVVSGPPRGTDYTSYAALPEQPALRRP